MSNLFGILFRCRHYSYPETIHTVLRQMASFGKERCHIWHDIYCGFGQSTNAYQHDEQSNQGVVFISEARLDNRLEIAVDLGLSSGELALYSDGDLIRRAYNKWGPHCNERLYGDWTFAVWHSAERRLFLARDHFGITSLYYYVDENIFAFSSSRKVLLALDLLPIKLDELYLAQILTSWSPDGTRTIHSPIRRLPPAHHLTVTPNQIIIEQYWYLEKTPLLHLSTREDYVEGFRRLFDDAVEGRLRTSARDGGVAATLSGGLDSSSVTATAAGYLAQDGRRVAAYTSVPLYDTAHFVKSRFGDEFPLAEATALFAGNVDIKTIDAVGCSPIQAIRQMLQISNQPEHAAGNFFWLLDLWKAAQSDGNEVLLLGQFGNAGVSWAGDVFSQSLLFQLRQLGCKKWTKEVIKRNLPPTVLKAWRHYRANPLQQYRASAINPAFAARLNLFEQRFDDIYEHPSRTALELRSFLQPGRSITGALHAELGAAFGLDVRDPTADARVLAFTFSVPDHIFIDPKTGIDRWLIREAMKGRLPDEVRLNRNRGRQAGDLVPRLRACAGEVEIALNELACGPAAEYVDVPYMRQVWQIIQKDDTPEAFQKSITILTRGIMAGLFVNGIYE